MNTVGVKGDKRGSRKFTSDAAYPWIFLTLFIVSWQIVSVVFNIPTYILPSPLEIVLKGIEIWRTLATSVLVTLKSVLSGFVVGSAVGMIFGFCMVYYPLVRKIFLPYIVAFQTMPKIGLAPLFIIWFGFGILTNVLIVSALSFFPVLVNFVTGLDQFNENEDRLMASYNASKNQSFFHVRLFRALPFLFTGLQLGIILSITGAIVAEFIAGDAGLGYLTILANNNLETEMMFCALILLGLLGFALYHMVTFFKGILMPWTTKTETLTTKDITI